MHKSMPRKKSIPKRLAVQLCTGYGCGGISRSEWISVRVHELGSFCSTCKELSEEDNVCVICSDDLDVDNLGCQTFCARICYGCMNFHQEICKYCSGKVLPVYYPNS